MRISRVVFVIKKFMEDAKVSQILWEACRRTREIYVIDWRKRREDEFNEILYQNKVSTLCYFVTVKLTWESTLTL